ncbi:RNA-directed DNA polymerase (Reverse transcriptase) [gut metagenome]|uniref:RNA-directed DNA polymerase (Reverse transcriptase) n=1 Tax=gut metagenome TaxID=749906 RepID=J9CZ57_9ZZZZ
MLGMHMKGKCNLTIHQKSKAKLKSRLKELTSRSNGWGYEKRKAKLNAFIRGWVGYYYLAQTKVFLERTDEWLRRRIRMCIWKAWKNPRTRIANLKRCGVLDWQAYQWGNTRLGYWRVADSRLVTLAMSNDKLKRAGYKTMLDSYLEWYPK